VAGEEVKVGVVPDKIGFYGSANTYRSKARSMEERNVDTWEEFKTELDVLLLERGKSEGAQDSVLLFRGQADSRWSLGTTLDRKHARMPFRDYYRLIGRIKPQIESLTNNDWPIPEVPEVERQSKDYEFYNLLWSGRCPAYAYMAYLRHHGFPSPLLDWSRSPYVASFFAFNTSDASSKGRVAIFVSAEADNRMHGNGIPMVLRYGPYVKTHRRHFLQQSEYTLCMVFEDEWLFDRYETVFDKGRHQQGTCWKFTVPTSERTRVLMELDKYNLNAMSLFGSEESMMETLSTREFSAARRSENSSMKSVVLLATIHESQMSRNDGNSELENRLDYLKSKFGAQTVMEEWTEKKGESRAKTFATKAGLHWISVGTPDEPPFQTYWGQIQHPAHNGTLPHDPDAPSLNEYGSFESQEARENWMVKKVQVEMENYDTGLFIIGVAHLHSLFSKLRSLDFKVTGYSWAG
jgi:hypothetical protein